MVARLVRNTMTDKDVPRLGAYKDGNGNKVIEYADGSVVRTERTGGAVNRADGRPALKEVRTITSVKTPGAHFHAGFGDVKYDRKLIARKEGTTHA